MSSITIRLEDELNNKLVLAAKSLSASKGYIMRQALKAYLMNLEEEIQDYKDALIALKDDNDVADWIDIKRECGLAD